MFNDLSAFTNIPEYSIAISIAKTAHGNHAGILTKSDKGIKFYHLAWHYTMDCTDISDYNTDPAFLLKKWVKFTSLTEDPIIASYRVIPIVKFLELVYSKNYKNIPYSLNFRNTNFNDEGKLDLGENEYGLTCATFIVSFFNSVAVNLIDLNTWIPRSEDMVWKASVLQLLARTGATFEHIASVSKEQLNFRIKPEEVAVASSRPEDELPANFEFCSTIGATFNTLKE